MGHHSTVLIIRDGWGHNPNKRYDSYNAIKLANTPCHDDLVERYPTTLIKTSGIDVGLPAGNMGNSEVGHQNIGAGRIVDQDSVRISRSMDSGEFLNNPAMCQVKQSVMQRQSTLHLMGLISDAGVHSRLNHLEGCLVFCRQHQISSVLIHAFTDGRDSGPFLGRETLCQVEQLCRKYGVGQIASLCGRYYAMDRDNRWERIEQAYRLLTDFGASTPIFDTWQCALEDYYQTPVAPNMQGDEFVTPRKTQAFRHIVDGDAVVFFNYRGDRPRQLTRAFVMDDFYGQVIPSPENGIRGFRRGDKLDLIFVTMTGYEEYLNPLVQIAFPRHPPMTDVAGEWLAKQGLKQFRCAETEKFPHVTFFFNDYREKAFENEDRQIIPSPTVPTYDLKPEMSAYQICSTTLEALDRNYDLLVINFANGDMVGHTGNLQATVRAVEVVDICVQRIMNKVLEQGGHLIITADHGNAEQMWDFETQAPHTAHTNYDVHCSIVGQQVVERTLRHDGRLADIIPTAFDLMGIPLSDAMTGKSLLLDT